MPRTGRQREKFRLCFRGKKRGVGTLEEQIYGVPSPAQSKSKWLDISERLKILPAIIPSHRISLLFLYPTGELHSYLLVVAEMQATLFLLSVQSFTDPPPISTSPVTFLYI